MTRSVPLVLCLMALAGCGITGSNHGKYSEFYAHDPIIRMEAFKRAGNAYDLEAAPHLIPALRDEESQVRLWAHIALLKIYYGPNHPTYAPPFPYDFTADKQTREAGVKGWENWWETDGEKRAAEKKSAPAASKK